MKKLVGIILVLFLISCSKDKDYISEVRDTSLTPKITVENYVDNNIISGEVYQLNNPEIFMEKNKLIALESASDKKVLDFLKNRSFIIPQNIEKATWKTDKEEQNKKILIASNSNIRIKLETSKDKNKIKIDKILTYDNINNSLISQKYLDTALNLYKLAIKYNYQSSQSQIEYKRFDEKPILNDKDNFYTLNYYPSGRVKFLSDGEIINLKLKDKSYLENIETSLNYLDSQIEKCNNKNINKYIDLSFEIEYKIISEKLNKNINSIDKEKLKSMEKRANIIYDKLQKKIDNFAY